MMRVKKLNYYPLLLAMLLFLILLNEACNNKRQVPKPISLQPVRSLSDSLNDSTFIRDVGSIAFADNKLYLADNRPQVIELGPHLNLLGHIYRYGKGPGEFTGIMALCFVNDSLFVYDRNQAKLLVYDNKNHLVREVELPKSTASDMAIDDHGHIFLSTGYSKHPITEFSAHGQKVRAFGINMTSKDNKHFRRTDRILIIHHNKLIAIAKSEPLIKIYNLEGKLIDETKIAPPAMHNLIIRVKKENRNPNFRGLSLLFYAASIWKNNIYLLEAKHTPIGRKTYVKKFTYLFKYRLDSNGHVTLENTFKLFHSDHSKLLYGFSMAAIGNHKIIVYDLMEKKLLVFKNKDL